MYTLNNARDSNVFEPKCIYFENGFLHQKLCSGSKNLSRDWSIKNEIGSKSPHWTPGGKRSVQELEQ